MLLSALYGAARALNIPSRSVCSRRCTPVCVCPQAVVEPSVNLLDKNAFPTTLKYLNGAVGVARRANPGLATALVSDLVPHES